MVIAVVAIPEEGDLVWQYSSEKKPHLSLLILGEQLNNVDRVGDFIEHAVNTSLDNPYLDLDVYKRGPLGEKNADVLYFYRKQVMARRLHDFRGTLLANDDIFTAYESVEQFPEWLPHLTMGYPETPAKLDERKYPGFHSVRFDRIALWTGDYEGREFELKREEDAVMHYGIKGMRWGVTREDRSAGRPDGPIKMLKKKAKEAYTPSTDSIESHRFMTRAKLGGVRNLSNKEMQHVIQRMQLEKQYKDLYGERQWHTAGLKWAGRFAESVLKDVVVSWLRNPFARAGKPDDGPIRAQAWTNGQNFAATIQNPRRRAIGQ